MKEVIIERAERMQTQMHEFVETTIKANPKVSYQDATNMFLLLQIAEVNHYLHLQAVSDHLR